MSWDVDDKEMIEALVAGMRSEYTPCPFCWGRLSNLHEEHASECPFPEWEKKIRAFSNSAAMTETTK